tara:strand:+ start:73 stop:753 length:681 start_codon:yes stop_codon:yes gene_type:complete
MTAGYYKMKENYNKKYQWLYENGFYLTSDKKRIFKLLTQYEIYKKITDIRGDIYEFGVFKGSSLIRLLTFSNYLDKQTRRFYAFDNYGPFPSSKYNYEKKFINKFEKNSGHGLNKDKLKNFIKAKGFKEFDLIKGNIIKTLPKFLSSNKKIKIALLHIDLDVYEPTYLVLEKLYKYIVKGGIIMFDDYKTIKGETKAVDDYFDSNLIKKKFIKSDKIKTPVYFIKR